MGKRYNRYGTRLLLQVDDEQTCSIPPQWTDVEMADPEIILGAGRTPLRLRDLLELADVVERLAAERSRKSKYAATVRRNTPRVADGINVDPKRSSENTTKMRKRRA